MPQNDELTKRKESLFTMIDADGSGTIDKKEFDKLYGVISTHVKEEMQEAQRMQEKLGAAKRRTKLALMVLAVLVPLIVVLLGGNAALVYSLLEATKETHVAAGGSALVNTDGTPVSTAAVYEEANFLSSIEMNDYVLPKNELKATTSMYLKDGDVEYFFKLAGIAFYSDTMADVFTDSGHVLAIDTQDKKVVLTIHDPLTARQLASVESLEHRRSLELPAGRRMDFIDKVWQTWQHVKAIIEIWK